MTRNVVNVLGVPVDAIDLDAAVGRVASWIEHGTSHYVCLTGVHGVIESQRSPEVLELHRGAGMVLADGAPLFWAGRSAGSTTIRQVRGVDLMKRMLREAELRGWSNYFYGGSPETLDLLLANVRQRYPKIVIAGSHSPAFGERLTDEIIAEVREIATKQPDLLWIGLGTPKQERWMGSYAASSTAHATFGVGAAFDFLAGTARQAPRWLRGSGFEWLYRLAREPRRLWRRYLFSNPRYVYSVLRRPPHLEELPPRD